MGAGALFVGAAVHGGSVAGMVSSRKGVGVRVVPHLPHTSGFRLPPERRRGGPSPVPCLGRRPSPPSALDSGFRRKDGGAPIPRPSAGWIRFVSSFFARVGNNRYLESGVQIGKQPGVVWALRLWGRAPIFCLCGCAWGKGSADLVVGERGWCQGEPLPRPSGFRLPLRTT